MIQLMTAMDSGGEGPTVMPVISCDICGKLIHDDAQAGIVWTYEGANGNVLTQEEGTNNNMVKPLFICDVSSNGRCWDIAKERFGGHISWENLERFVRFLLFNTARGLRPTLGEAKTVDAVEKATQCPLGKKLAKQLSPISEIIDSELQRKSRSK